MTQSQHIHRLLLRRWLTPLTALQLAGCLSLSQRCGELRRRGVNVASKWVKVGGKRIKAYRVIKTDCTKI